MNKYEINTFYDGAFMHLKPQIAMIDDEYDIIDTYKDLLGDKYSITDFSCAEDYLDYLTPFEKNPFDVIIADYRLGGVTGLEMIESARNINKHTAFILMSGHLDKETALRAHNMGAHRILSKPTRVEMIDDEIKNLIYEGQIDKVRAETKRLTLKMKELCGLFDSFLTEHFSQKQINDYFMTYIDATSKKTNGDFKNYVADIEEKLYRNIKMEEILLRQLNKKGN